MGKFFKTAGLPRGIFNARDTSVARYVLNRRPWEQAQRAKELDYMHARITAHEVGRRASKAIAFTNQTPKGPFGIFDKLRGLYGQNNATVSSVYAQDGKKYKRMATKALRGMANSPKSPKLPGPRTS